MQSCAMKMQTCVVHKCCVFLVIYSSSKCHSLDKVKQKDKLLKEAYLYVISVSCPFYACDKIFVSNSIIA